MHATQSRCRCSGCRPLAPTRPVHTRKNAPFVAQGIATWQKPRSGCSASSACPGNSPRPPPAGSCSPASLLAWLLVPCRSPRRLAAYEQPHHAAPALQRVQRSHGRLHHASCARAAGVQHGHAKVRDLMLTGGSPSVQGASGSDTEKQPALADMRARSPEQIRRPLTAQGSTCFRAPCFPLQ